MKNLITYENRVKWFMSNYYESGMEYGFLLESMKDYDLDDYTWYDEKIYIPKYKHELNNHNQEQRKEIFVDTLDKFKDSNITKYVSSETEKHNTSVIELLPRNYKTNVEVINSDTVSAAHQYSNLGKTAILNMASAKKPGGGVINGARAQEECLFRCSNLHNLISKELYPIKEDEALYTNNSFFIKDVNYKQITPFIVDTITIPAVNLNKNAVFDDFKVEENYETTMLNKIRLMFTLAASEDCTNIIVGAWGCGVFGNDPKTVANMFKTILYEEDYKSCFENVIFAIINDHNSVDDNLGIFKTVMEE